jgi:hypothetical protein
MRISRRISSLQREKDLRIPNLQREDKISDERTGSHTFNERIPKSREQFHPLPPVRYHNDTLCVSGRAAPSPRPNRGTPGRCACRDRGVRNTHRSILPA